MLIPEANIAICQNRSEQDAKQRAVVPPNNQIRFLDEPTLFAVQTPVRACGSLHLPLKFHAAAAISAQGGASNPKRGKSGNTNNK